MHQRSELIQSVPIKMLSYRTKSQKTKPFWMVKESSNLTTGQEDFRVKA